MIHTLMGLFSFWFGKLSLIPITSLLLRVIDRQYKCEDSIVLHSEDVEDHLVIDSKEEDKQEVNLKKQESEREVPLDSNNQKVCRSVIC